VRLLLDTHVLLWWLTDDGRLGPGIRSLLESRTTEATVSSVCVAEISIKSRLGKLPSQPDLLEELEVQGFGELPFTHAHAVALQRLPMHHRDPFDRMLVVQAQVERMTLVTADARCAVYDVTTLSTH
jgi:PIN domain nuclease of toxin-antitoxin system